MGEGSSPQALKRPASEANSALLKRLLKKGTTVILKPRVVCWAEESAFVFNVGGYKQIPSTNSGQALRFAQDDRINAFFTFYKAANPEWHRAAAPAALQ
jgi:hypothetical protein